MLRITLAQVMPRAARAFDESEHPRVPAGQPGGGQFTDGGGGGSSSEKPAASEGPKLDPAVTEVGGDKWNQATAERLEQEYQQARPKVEHLADSAVGSYSTVTTDDEEDEEPPFEPEEWDQLSGSGQDNAKEEYISKATNDYYDSEVENWQSEYAPDEARTKVAEEFNDGTEVEWATDVLDELRADREDAGKSDFPYTNDQLLDAIHIDYEDQGGSWPKHDAELTFDDDKLQQPTNLPPPEQGNLPGIEPAKPEEHLTEDMREEIEKAMLKAFEKRADKVVDDLEPPEYLKENAAEFAGESWDQWDDEDKFQWTKNNTSIVEDESTSGSGPSTSTEEITVDALPDTFDPLNDTSGQDYQRTQQLARYLSVARAREVLAERNLGSPSDSQLANVDKKLWSSWKGSSTSTDGKLLQLATADELGGRLNTSTSHSAGDINRDDLVDYADSHYGSIGGYKGIKAYVRAKWEVTQYLLDKAGVKTLDLYRGIKLKQDVYEKLLDLWLRKHWAAHEQVTAPGGKYNAMPTLHVVRNGAASTTTDPNVANGWGSGDTRIVLRAQVPRTAAISVPAYGINIHSEHEVVVAGTAWKGWDAWAGKAPLFEDVPLRHAK